MGNRETESKGIEIDKSLKDTIYLKGIIKYFVVFKINYPYVKPKF